MVTRVKKRDGRIVPFTTDKITSAIARAGAATGEFGECEAHRLTLQVLDKIPKTDHKLVPSVEEIQDLVERVLHESPFFNTAKAYILYRDQHSSIRAIASKADTDLVDEYIRRLDWKVNENSNMSYSLQGMNNYLSAEITSEYWLKRIYTPEMRDAHQNGYFHIHDLNQLSVYCVGWDLMNLLKKGFRGVPGKVESGPPKHFRSALGQIVNFFYTLQGEAAGAQALSNFDTLLAPFVRHDNLKYPEVKQAIQEFIFNLNVPTRVGFQAPFTNITLDLNLPFILKDHPVMIGGRERDTTYADFQPEMDLINRAFAEIMLAGDASGRIFSFPIPTYNIIADFDWDNPSYELIWKMTGKYGIPYFSNFVNSDLSPEDTRSMCCRLRLDNKELLKRGGGLFGSTPLTGSIGVVTINLPRIGYLAENRQEFLDRLGRMVCLAAESLTIKRKVLEKFTEQKLYPYSKFYLNGIKQSQGKYWQNHFSTIGIIGMNEACLNFLGVDIADEIGRTFTLEVMDHIRVLLANIQEQSGDLFNLEATPAEGATYRLAMLDKEQFPEIICANETAYQKGLAPFYTNSTHLSVNSTDDIFQTLIHQDELQAKYSGGTVLHIYTGEQIDAPEAVKNLVRKITTSFSLPYFTITPTFSICQAHGYLNGIHERCPQCGEPAEVFSRIVGYYRPVDQWNVGKQAEFQARKVFKVATTI